MPKSKKPDPVVDLPAEAMPITSSAELIEGYCSQLKENGTAAKVLALTLNTSTSWISMLRSGKTDLSLPRLLNFAAAARLTREQTFDLLTTRLLELHGKNGDICAETLALWAKELQVPVSDDEQALLQMWKQATVAAPHMDGLLASPSAQKRVQALLDELAQEAYEGMAEGVA